LESVVSDAPVQAEAVVAGFSRHQVIGIGVDTTGSSPIPADETNQAIGIAEKNAILMQTYADILGREMYRAASRQACARGSAVAAQ
jgi:ribulose kinase